MDLVYFVILVGVLIFVHELGHFAWAKFFGVTVLRFSLGFGPRLAGFRKGETEYVVAAIPLGGYVKMLGESPDDTVAPDDEGHSFNGQPLWKRIVIVFAGPAMNLIFPVLLYFVVFLGDSTLPPPIVGTVFPGRPAEHLLEPGDRIESIAAEAVGTFYDVNRIVAANPDQPLDFVVERDGRRVAATITPALTHVLRDPPELGLLEDVGRIGIWQYHPLAVVGLSPPDGPAAAARLRTFDRIVSAGGQRVDLWLDLDRALAGNRGATVPLTYLRPQRVEHALGGLVEVDVYEPHVATLTPEAGSGSGVRRAGLEPADLYVSYVTIHSPEHRMGLLPGDRLRELDGRPIKDFRTFLEDLEAGRGDPHELSWTRGNVTHSARFRLRHERGVTGRGQPFDRYVVGMRNWVPMRTADPVANPRPLSYAWSRALESTWELVEVTVFSVVRLLQGRLSVDTIGGPISVFEVAGMAAREGARDYLRFMAFISINLGLINLLPIPLLDGGHLLFFLIESVSRRRLGVKVRQYASLAGLSLLLVLMLLAFKNDLERQWPNIVETFEGE